MRWEQKLYIYYVKMAKFFYLSLLNTGILSKKVIKNLPLA